MIADYKKKIPFFDVDPMRVVWHGNYVKYFEEARCAYLVSKNMTYNDMDRLGFSFPIVEMKIKYIHPCTFGQEIIVRTKLENCKNFLLFRYEIFDASTGKKLCKAKTKQMCISMKTQESLFEIPEIILKKLEIR